MARFYTPTQEQVDGWNAWVAQRPPHVRAVAERFDPWSLYRMKDGRRVTVVSFGERPDGHVTLTVNISGEFNIVTFERSVFGIEPDDLEPCDLPPEGERVGALLTDEADIRAYVDAVRPHVLANRGKS